MGKHLKIMGGLFISMAFLAAASFYLQAKVHPSNSGYTKMILLGGEVFRVEIADTHQKTSKGLGGRVGLCRKCGMLFVFNQAEKRSFWMKDMKFSLDIIWLEEDRIVAIEKNIRHDTLETFSPPVSADRVLEINAGEVDRLELEIGDRVRF